MLPPPPHPGISFRLPIPVVMVLAGCLFGIRRGWDAKSYQDPGHLVHARTGTGPNTKHLVRKPTAGKVVEAHPLADHPAYFKQAYGVKNMPEQQMQNDKRADRGIHDEHNQWHPNWAMVGARAAQKRGPKLGAVGTFPTDVPA